MRSYEKLAGVLAEHLRSGLEGVQEQRLDGVVVEARVSRVELRISDGAQNSESLLQRRAMRMEIKNGRGIIKAPEVMVFGAAGVGERFEVGGIGDGVGGAGKRSQGERHGARVLKRQRKERVSANVDRGLARTRSQWK